MPTYDEAELDLTAEVQVIRTLVSDDGGDGILEVDHDVRTGWHLLPRD